MKTWKLVAGILSILSFILVSFQSCAVGIFDAIENEGSTSGSIGLIVAILLLVGGIVSISVRNAKGKGGDISILIIFGIAATIGFTGYQNYSDLIIWSIWCLINALLALVDMIKNKR